MKTVILIPAYKPEESFVDFSERLIARGHRVVAVNDGSGEEFDGIFERVEAMGVTVLRHDVNRGKGRALKTGFGYIVESENDTDFVVTADCDGQHKIEDIERLIAAEEENPGAFIFCRQRKSEEDAEETDPRECKSVIEDRGIDIPESGCHLFVAPEDR